MAVSVRIEDEAFSDGRYDELAEYAGLADADHARSKMEHLWRQCTLEQTYALSAFLVRKYLGPNGVESIIRARLGELQDDGSVRVRGAKGRIEWLKKLRDNGRFGKKGGRPRKNPQGFRSANPDGGAKNEKQLTPPVPVPVPVPTEEEEPARPATPLQLESPKANRKPARPAELSGEHASALAHFSERFLKASGLPYVWAPKDLVPMAALVKAQGLDEVRRRIDLLFDGRGPAWLQAPYTAGTLVAQWNALAAPAPPVSPNRRTEPKRNLTPL